MKTIEKHKLTLFLGLLLVLLTFGTTLKAQLPSPSNPPRLVNDYTGTLSDNQIKTLEHKLEAYNDSTSTQILVLLVDDLQGMSIDQYGTEIGHSWGVGQKGKSNGFVILVKPKKNGSKGYAGIYPGYGVEEYATDATCDLIVKKEMIPAFKENEYYTGIDNAVNVIMDLCSGKFSQDDYKDDGYPLWLTILVIIAVVVIFIKFSGGGGQNYTGGSHRTIWIPMGGFGGGGFGGGSGGGFGGFGGGGFGGGGASGSW